MNSALMEVQAMKKTIEDANRKIDILTGRKEEVLSRIKKEFSVDSIEEAQEFIRKEEERIEKEEASLMIDFNKVKEHFIWD